MRQKGFTVIELLVVIALIGLLASIVLVSFNLPERRYRATVAKSLQFSQSIQNALGIDAVGWWNFDQGEGTKATDTSGNGNTGQLCDSTDCGAGKGPTRTDDTPHKVAGTGGGKYALSFDGNDYVDVSYTTALLPSSITMEAWAKAYLLPVWAGIVTNKDDANYGINLQMGTAQNIAALVGDGSSWVYVRTDWVPQTGVWYYIVVTHDAVTNLNKLYVNGKLEKTETKGLTYNAKSSN